MIAALAHRAWVAANHGRWRRFRRALADPARVQERLLRDYLRRNAATLYGRRHHFADVDSAGDFERRVPLVDYDDLVPWIDRLRRGERAVLTREPPLRLVPSGGSTAAAKLIPYTRRSQDELARAVGPWIVDLHRRRPRAFAGRAYWSVSPPATMASVPSAVPVGFDDDAATLGGAARRLVDATLAVPPSVRLAGDVEAFRHATLLHLLRACDLSLVSVWHPSFFTLLLDALTAAWPRLLAQLPRRRAAELEGLDPAAPAAIWPRLELVSCWRDAHAAAPARELERRLPGVAVEAKGLLATEAAITVPFEGRRPLAVESHYFEFLDDAGRPRRLAELADGGRYSVVVTTGGGLYRYRLRDLVEVEGFLGATPCLRFLGKEDRVSDRRGEKLAEGHVAAALRQVLEPLDLGERFAMLAPEDGEPPSYTLFLESGREPPADLGERLDRALGDNPHYRLCRALGQLAPPRVARVAAAQATFLEHHRRRGQRLGDVKPTALSREDGWAERFTPTSKENPT